MIFKPKGFFLDLDKDAPAKPAVVAPVAAKPAPAKGKAAKAEAKPAKAVATSPAAEETTAAASGSAPVLTTAEAIAAELRLEQENRPAPSLVTFSPGCLTPAGALPRARRRAGANLAGFKAMASSLLRS
jgi:hypothetical protein